MVLLPRLARAPLHHEPHHRRPRRLRPVRLRTRQHDALPVQHGLPRGREPERPPAPGVGPGHDEQLPAVAVGAGREFQARAARAQGPGGEFRGAGVELLPELFEFQRGFRGGWVAGGEGEGEGGLRGCRRGMSVRWVEPKLESFLLLGGMLQRFLRKKRRTGSNKFLWDYYERASDA